MANLKSQISNNKSQIEFVLGIESSCDETAAAIYCPLKSTFFEKIARQFKTHSPYGGVVPELASRCHLETVSELVFAVCSDAGIKLNDIDIVSTTSGPGLAGALIVGLSYGKALAFSLNKPFVAVNHIEAHIYAACAETDVHYPFLALVVSGGHTIIADIHDKQNYTILGRTKDDAAGEAFDKGAKILELGYPGGQLIDKISKNGNPKAYDFPRAMMQKDSLDFSFSGLKTALLYFHQKNPDAPVEDVAASYQEAIVDALVKKTLRAAKMNRRKTIVIGGGVSANNRLREKFIEKSKDIKVIFPSFPLCTDNARMIAYRGYILYKVRGADTLDTDIFPSFNYNKKSV
jgi:N6-L-threonylcarbamoyladenine synthase